MEYWRLPNRDYIVKYKQNEKLECKTDIRNTKTADLGSFISSNSKRIMNNFICEIKGFQTNNVYYTDTDSLFIE